MPDSSASSSLRRDIASTAYLASASRITSWVVVSALIYRRDVSAFAVLTLIRSTIGLLNYTTLGLAPAMIHSIAQMHTVAAGAWPSVLPVDEPPLTVHYADRMTQRNPRDVNDGLRRSSPAAWLLPCSPVSSGRLSQFFTRSGLIVFIDFRFRATSRRSKRR